jgi:zinc protease
MKRIILSISALALCINSYQSLAQAKLVETIKKAANETVIPYQKYVFPNGLTLIVHEDHSDPIAHVDVTYHVGSAREEIGKSGFAHFFEHMMFQGSDNVADEQHFKIITEAGGTLNGTTNRDRTNYFETVPANQVEKMLWLEADRMGFLLDAVTQKKFEVQRATVKNERGQRYDNRPYGLVGEVAGQNLYPYGHPYSWLTIGYVEDLNRVDVNDLKNFFLRWYGPNNAVITVGGDVNTAQVVKWVEKYFGSIPKGPGVTNMKVPLPVLERNRYISMTDNYAKLPMLRIVYPSTPFYSKQEPALDCLAEIIGQGNTSLLYKNLVKKQVATSASAYNYTSELSGEFTINITPYKGISLAELEKVVKATFQEFEERGVTDEDIKKYKTKQEAQIIYGLESVSGKVSQLAAFHTFTGDANYIGKHLKANTSFTKEDVMNAYRTYIKDKYALVISVLTKEGNETPANVANYTVKETDVKQKDEYAGLKYNKAKDNFDRAKVPSESNAVVVNAPNIWTKTIDNNNIRVMGTESQEIPVVNLILNFKGGKLTDDPNKLGTAKLFADMMEEDTKTRSAEAFSSALEQLGSSINIGASNDKIVVQVRSLSKNLDATLDLLKERLLSPAFNEEDFARNKKMTIEGIKRILNQPEAVASRVYSSVLYGAGSKLGMPISGTEQSVTAITLEDIQNYYNTNFSKRDLEIIVVGDVKESAIIEKLKFLNALHENAVSIETNYKAPAAQANTIYFVDVPNAAQTEFRVGYLTDMTYDATGPFYQSGIMNYPLGGAFNSRLNLYLREDKGWTYGARSGFSSDKYAGEYTFSAGIKADATDSALVDVLRIMNEYKNKGCTTEELAFTKSSMSQSEALKYETGFQKAGFLNRMLTYNLSPNYTTEQQDILKMMTTDRVNKFAAEKIPGRNQLVIVLVGDKAKYADKLQKQGFNIVMLDKNGIQQ